MSELLNTLRAQGQLHVAGVAVEEGRGGSVTAVYLKDSPDVLGLGRRHEGLNGAVETRLDLSDVDEAELATLGSAAQEPGEAHPTVDQYKNVQIIRRAEGPDGVIKYRLFEWSAGDVTQRPVRL